MDKIRENLLKAIDEKTNAYHRLSVKDIFDLSQALTYIYKSEMIEKNKIEFERFEEEANRRDKEERDYLMSQTLYGRMVLANNDSLDTEDGSIVGFCD